LYKTGEWKRVILQRSVISKWNPSWHWMQEGLFFYKKTWKYCDGVLKYFTMFSPEKLQKNKSYFMNILFQIILL